MRENHQKHRPNGAAAEGGRPIGAPPKAAPVFLISSYHISALQTQVRTAQHSTAQHSKNHVKNAGVDFWLNFLSDLVFFGPGEVGIV